MKVYYYEYSIETGLDWFLSVEGKEWVSGFVIDGPLGTVDIFDECEDPTLYNSIEQFIAIMKRMYKNDFNMVELE